MICLSILPPAAQEQHSVDRAGRFAAACLAALTLTSLQAHADTPQALIEHAAQHPAGDTPCSFDRALFDQPLANLPVGVFDSGIGGLTVLDALLRLDVFDNNTLQPKTDGLRDFTAERFVYFGDQANMPYGNYASAGREDLLRELILRDAIFLLRGHDSHPPVKAIVIACNTATAFGLEDIRTALKAWRIDIPVVGVVEAGARGLMESLPSAERPDAVAVLATVGTCGCEAYPRAISRSTGLAGKPMPVIIQQGCVGLAGAIEGDPAFVRTGAHRDVPYQGPRASSSMLSRYGFSKEDISGDELLTVAAHVRFEVTTLVERHRLSGDTTPIGYVVLGCTHFPLVQQEITGAFEHLRTFTDDNNSQPYRALIRNKLTFINPAEFSAKELFRELARHRLRLKPDDSHALEHDAFFMSVPDRNWPGVTLTASGTLDADYKHGRTSGDFLRNDTPAVPMSAKLLPSATAAAIEKLMPDVWQRLNR